jgi:uncharacterized delta-60 repeat protein
MAGPYRRIRARLLAVALATGLAAGLVPGAHVPAAHAAPGDLDTSFGVGGTATLNHPLPPSSSNLLRRGLNVDPAGRILTSQWSSSSNPRLASVVRLLPNGSPDPAFGTNAYATVDLSVPGLTVQVGNFALLPDGKVLVYSGGIVSGYTPSALVLVRLLPDGSPDATYGDGGKVVVRLPERGVGAPQSVVAVPDGHVYVSLGDASIHTGFKLARITPAGALDTSYGVGGIVHTGRGPRTAPTSMSLTPDGKILMVGAAAGASVYDWDFLLARFLPDGSRDPSFGEGGIAVADVDDNDFPADRHVFLPDGSVLVAGSRALTRFHDNGSIDRSFFDGKFNYTSPIGPSSIQPVASLTPTGKIAAASTSNSGTLRRIIRVDLATGAEDQSFGSRGAIFVGLGDALQMVSYGGKLITLDNSQSGTFIRRYHNDGTAVAPLRVTATCPPTSPNLGWRVTNPNGQPLRFSWRIAGTGQRGGGVAASNGQVTFSSSRVIGRNRVELLVDGLVVGAAEACKVVVRPRV